MKRLLLIACVLSCTVFAKAKDWTQYINPLMGSQSTFELSTGNTYPAIARPQGNELLDSADRKNGRRLAIHLYRQ